MHTVEKNPPDARVSDTVTGVSGKDIRHTSFKSCKGKLLIVKVFLSKYSPESNLISKDNTPLSDFDFIIDETGISTQHIKITFCKFYTLIINIFLI